MQVTNLLPDFLLGMTKWTAPPTAQDLSDTYLRPNESTIGMILSSDDASEIALDLKSPETIDNWSTYREQVLTLDPTAEERRLRKHIKAVEELFGLELQGEVILFGAFKYMDGYARFDRGGHRVFLAVDENHTNGSYIDILTTHELSHVARESQPTVWEGFGLNPKMTQNEFTEFQPVIEHLFGEGLSCAASERLVPNQDPWLYAYQDPSSYQRILKNAKKVSAVIHRELLSTNGDYGRLYQTHHYGKNMPDLTHYVWAWHWVRQVASKIADGDYRWLVERCSNEFFENALNFQLNNL